MNDAAALEILGRLYRDVDQPQAWQRLVEDVRASSGAGSVNLQFIHPRPLHLTELYGVGFDERLIREYPEHWVHRDPFHRFTTRPKGSVIVTARELPPKAFGRAHSDILRDWIIPQGFLPEMVLGIIDQSPTSRASLGMMRSARSPEFGAEEERTMRLLLPHVSSAFQLYRRVAGLRRSNEALIAALDRVALGVVLVDSRGRLVCANALARALLDEAEGVRLAADGTLRAADRRGTSELHARVEEAARLRDGIALGSTGAVRLDRPPPRRPIVALVIPAARDSTLATEDSSVAAIILLSDPEYTPLPSADLLHSVFGLTAMEARVTLALARGRVPKEVAVEFGISWNTVRNHVQHALRKAGVERQSELVVLVRALFGTAPSKGG